MKSLLTREQFREGVFKRDRMTCVVPGCGRKMKSLDDKNFDAHHIYERRLWEAREEQGGYFLDNGVTVCDHPHHMLAEKNAIPPQAFHRWIGIEPLLPKALRLPWWTESEGFESIDELKAHFDESGRPYPSPIDRDFNKWGEPFKMPTRTGTDLKYPTTYYLPFSPRPEGHESDVHEDLGHWVNVPLVVTAKMDGSNVKLVGGADGYVASRAGHERSASHPSFDYLKARFQQDWQWRIPEGIVVFGEWLYARHSIHYEGDMALKSYLQVFGAYDPQYRLFLGWEEVERIAAAMGVPTTPVIAQALFTEKWTMVGRLEGMFRDAIDAGHEGIVVRSVYPFHYGQFQTWLGKAVRENHVQTDEHWTQQKLVKNEVKK